MVGNLVFNMVAAGLGAFSFTLLIPFLNALFNKPDLLPKDSGWITALQDRTIGLLLDPNDPKGSLGHVIVVIVVIVAIPGFLPVWVRIEQAACGVLLLPAAILVNLPRASRFFPTEAARSLAPEA